ncbi:hypothetical protein [Lacticaseibacillus sp. N501-2]|uniref:hypothetical protein n=1 Tax=Lacticaseibacillus salsurae TaxID=3367729 RepID=UPI0038B34FDC
MSRSNYHSVVGWGAYGIFLILSMIWSQRVKRDNRRFVTIMWQLADALGYGAADLKRLAGKYGELAWAATRLERLDFFPGVKLIKSVTHQMKCEQQLREVEAKQWTDHQG